MNRVYSIAFVVLLLASFSSQAQISINAREVPHTIGMQFQYYSQSGDSIPVNVGSPGGPQTWDFTAGDTSLVSTDLYLDPQTSPPEYSRANVVIQTDQLNFAGLNEPGVMYCYLHPQRFIFGAATTVFEGDTLGIMFQPFITQYTLPLQMGSSWTNNIVIDDIYEFPDYDIRLELQATLNSEVDAYGTVQVPLGDFETLRILNHVTYDLTVSIRFLWVWIPILEESGEAINYDWRAEDVGLVLNVTAQGSNPNFEYADAVRRLMNSSLLASAGVPLATLPSETPQSSELAGNFPNPFNDETVISYELSQAMDVDVRIFDVMGRQVAVLVQGYRAEGSHEVRWAPENLAAGLYFIQLRAGQQVKQHPIVYLK